MTHAELANGCRFLLRDTARMSDTGAHFYSDATLARALTDSLAVVLRTLVLQKPRRATIATNAVAAFFTPAWTGAAPDRYAPLPDNFFILECGSIASGPGAGYVPAIRTELGETIAALATVTKLYARAGRLYGPEADSVCYFRRPVTVVAKSTAVLPDFSDAVYNCAKMLACRDTVIQESKGASHRWQFFDADYQMQLQSLL